MPETNTAAFTFVKQGVFYFTRRVPNDLSCHYTAKRISFSLRTRSAKVATSRALRAAQQLDEHWYHLRVSDAELPGKHMLRFATTHQHGAATSVQDEHPGAVTLSEAVAIYLRHKGKGRPVTFHRGAERSCGYVIDVCGDKAITAFTRADANAFRDALVSRELAGSSITRVFGTVRSVVNFAAAELGITITNPFAGVYYDRKAGVEERQPLSLDNIRLNRAGFAGGSNS